MITTKRGDAVLSVADGEALLSVPDAFEKATGCRPSGATCWRWAKKGVNGVRLETVRLGSRVKTTPAAALRFIVATQNSELDDVPKGRSANDSSTRPRELATAS